MTEFDEDLLARQEARTLCRRAGQAQQTLETLPQEKLDAIVRAMAAAFEGECASLAKMAVEETGFGNTQDKTETRGARRKRTALPAGMCCVPLNP